MITDTHTDTDTDTDTDLEFAALLDRRDVHMVFQPVVDLHSGEIVAVEALARGPVATRFESPLALFAAARRSGRVAELDWVCRAAAFRAVLAADVPPAMTVFVNVEPEAIAAECPTDLTAVVARAESILRVFVEVNDRALAANPAGVLAAVDRAREMGWGIAIDDVGASRAPVAMLPIVRPDVVKLDLRLFRLASAEDSAAILTSVLRYIDTVGATLLVEGIESEDDAQWARALGAAYGQGLHLAAPGPLYEHYTAPHTPVRLIRVASADLDITSPFDLFADRPHQSMGRAHLEELALVLAYSPRVTGARPIFISCVGRDGRASDLMIEHGLAQESLLFVTFGTGLPGEPAAGMRGVRLRAADPLADERFLIVLSAQAPMAIFARRSLTGNYDVVVTQERELVHDVARHLIRRVPGPGRNNTVLPVPARQEAVDARVEADATVPVNLTKRGWRGRLGGHQ